VQMGNEMGFVCVLITRLLCCPLRRGFCFVCVRTLRRARSYRFGSHVCLSAIPDNSNLACRARQTDLMFAAAPAGPPCY
jgi:hypothetical protein